MVRPSINMKGEKKKIGYPNQWENINGRKGKLKIR
jgi:hypothetical protein